MACCRGATFERVKPLTLPGFNHMFTRMMLLLSQWEQLTWEANLESQLGKSTIGIQHSHGTESVSIDSYPNCGGLERSWL